MEGVAGSITLRPNKPERYEGHRDFLVVNTWLYKMEQYLALVQLGNPNVQLTDGNRISYASTFFMGTAAVWWFTVVQSNNAPGTWVAFKESVVAEFVPPDHIRRSRDKLRKLKHTGSVSKFLAEFRNIILTIPEITDGEKFDKFCSSLKYEVRVEVLKSACTTFEEATAVALRIDSALWGAKEHGTSNSYSSNHGNNGPVPMEIGNLEKGPDRGDSETRRQRQMDLDRNACFQCHKEGCRPWKHREKKGNARVTNVGVSVTNPEPKVDTDEYNSSGSEN